MKHNIKYNNEQKKLYIHNNYIYYSPLLKKNSRNKQCDLSTPQFLPLFSHYNLTINLIIIQFLNQRGKKTAIEYETSLIYNIKSIIQ